MTSSDASRQFQWRDRCGLVWDVYLIEDDETSVSWCAETKLIGGTQEASVQTHDHSSRQQLLMARLAGVQVDERMQNRGVGSILIEKAVEECKRRGYKGIEGDLSLLYGDPIEKLKYFYEKNGFSVVLYEPRHPDYKPHRVGKIELIF